MWNKIRISNLLWSMEGSVLVLAHKKVLESHFFLTLLRKFIVKNVHSEDANKL